MLYVAVILFSAFLSFSEHRLLMRKLLKVFIELKILTIFVHSIFYKKKIHVVFEISLKKEKVILSLSNKYNKIVCLYAIRLLLM